jgi:hypothetical protein
MPPIRLPLSPLSHLPSHTKSSHPQQPSSLLRALRVLSGKPPQNSVTGPKSHVAIALPLWYTNECVISSTKQPSQSSANVHSSRKSEIHRCVDQQLPSPFAKRAVVNAIFPKQRVVTMETRRNRSKPTAPPAPTNPQSPLPSNFQFAFFNLQFSIPVQLPPSSFVLSHFRPFVTKHSSNDALPPRFRFLKRRPNGNPKNPRLATSSETPMPVSTYKIHPIVENPFLHTPPRTR